MSPATLSPPTAPRTPPPLAAVVGPHAARVATWLTRGAADPPADPAVVLRRRGYLPPALADSGDLALAFAAAAFPNKPAARLVGDAELQLRVAAFADVVACLPARADRTHATVRAALRAADRLPTDLSEHDADELAGDLAGDTAHALGGLLHLATLTAEQVARVVANWRAERDLVRFVRGTLLSPPSQFGAGLAALFPGVSAGVLAAAVELERDARVAAGRVLDSGRVADAVAAFWEGLVRDRLRSGFPYFGFRSRFRTWWNQCLLTHPWERPPVALPADTPAAPEPAADPELDLLRACREVYRVVRTTFFTRSAADPAGGTPEYRRAADAIWARRLERAGDGLPPDPLDAIRTDFPWLTAAGANNLSHRVRMRMLAGVKARVDRWRNAEILGLTTPARMRDEPGVTTVATVCRAALPSESLAGAFAAHVWLGGVVRPRHAEAPTAAGLRAELPHWAGPGFRAAVRRGAAAGSRADRLLDAMLDGEESDDATEAAVAEMIGPAARAAAGADRLRAWAALAGHEWVAPVWFLVGVERRSAAWVVARLLPDDVAAVTCVAREVAAATGGAT